jgi:general stress protein YciG
MNEIKKYLSKIGRKGGEAGKGEAKRRGDSEYYKRIRNGKKGGAK